MKSEVRDGMQIEWDAPIDMDEARDSTQTWTVGAADKGQQRNFTDVRNKL